MSKNPIVHWELMAPDGSALKEFYGGLFDWEFESPEGFPEYFMVGDSQVGVGGAIGRGMDEMPAYSAIYVQVADIDETPAQVEATGGKTVAPRTVIPNVVIFGMFNDPAGNLVALVEEGS